MDRTESDQKYNQSRPSFPFRIDREMLELIPKPKGPWIEDAIKQKLELSGESDSRDTEVKSRNTREQLLFFLIQEFIELGLEINFPDELETELLSIIKNELK